MPRRTDRLTLRVDLEFKQNELQVTASRRPNVLGSELARPGP